MNQVTVKNETMGYQISEAYKSLRTNFQFCGEDKKVIAITSCTMNEGKSSISMQLAVSLAESGKHVLLIDADLRKSVLMGRTKVSQKGIMGLTHFLTGQCTIQETICATSVKNFHLIYSGPFPPNPAELLGGKYFKSLIEAIRNVYDYVIIDTPPLGSVIDSAIIAEICDGAIMVIESGVISYRFAQEVKKQLEKSNCPILGVVLNKVDMHKQSYEKYHGRYYGRHYGKYQGKYEEKSEESKE
ncbi:polysaccharide biosynthesis tyrosine autokinase [Novisyntrophococcus fermenticellae]|uniref:polysaccharide biosynthesis tyrosine autokinase n=1 Tax=Novisyntrophococcus fermenticellae TaxID=2068655 RepID=UPI002E75C64F|nr:polysaccharide biosynthesis tyrosine autokinase [Novisyntrophococcus fermenticellae]